MVTVSTQGSNIFGYKCDKIPSMVEAQEDVSYVLSKWNVPKPRERKRAKGNHSSHA
jgi:hypothetical protein